MPKKLWVRCLRSERAICNMVSSTHETGTGAQTAFCEELHSLTITQHNPSYPVPQDGSGRARPTKPGRAGGQISVVQAFWPAARQVFRPAARLVNWAGKGPGATQIRTHGQASVQKHTVKAHYEHHFRAWLFPSVDMGLEFTLKCSLLFAIVLDFRTQSFLFLVLTLGLAPASRRAASPKLSPEPSVRLTKFAQGIGLAKGLGCARPRGSISQACRRVK